MKIAISYPPIVNQYGQKAMVSQNRNVQYFKEPTYLLPVTYAQAATWIKQLGHDVYWDDGNAQLKTYDQWLNDLVAWKPDIVVFESTTPVMKFYWRTVNQVKERLPNCIVIMTGYHSMRMPEETMQQCAADIVLRSNHVDFVLSRLLPIIAENTNWRLTCSMEGLLIRIKGDELRSTGNFRQVEPLDKSPLIDRDLVQWKNYAYENGNYLQTPGTYATSVIRDCMFGKCTFCRYNGPDLTFSMMTVQRSLDEYETLINKYGVKEIFDDSGVWYRGKEAREFAQGIIDRGLDKKGCYFGINTRFEYLDEETIALMAKANFRFVLLGYEAADEETLRRLNKGYQLQHVENCLKWMTKYGLHPHLTIMAGNVVTGDMTEELILAGADIVKVGIGPGSVCTTRKMTGVGYPQLSAVIECADAAHGLGGQICADGGCVVPGDLAKAFGAGADFIMLGGMLAGHDECAGDLVERDGKKFKQFYGMSSRVAMEKYAGGVARYRASEGKEVLVPSRGPVADTLQDILGGVRSACTYVGAHKLKELTKRTTFIRVTQQLNEVFGKS